MSKTVYINSLVTAVAILAIVLGMREAAGAQAATVVTLTQTACQFVESENGVDHGFMTAKADDCRAINATTAEERLDKANALRLKPGKYIFRLTNKNVPYGLGFWLRGKGLGRLVLPSVSAGGLARGTTKDYAVELKEGEYLYSCPH